MEKLIPVGGVYFFNKIKLLEQFLSYCHPDSIYSNLDFHRTVDDDRTMYFSSTAAAAMQMLSTLYNEMHQETHEYINGVIQENEHLPLAEYHQIIDPLAKQLPGGHLSFTMSNVRPQMPFASHSLLVMKIQISHLKNQKLSNLLAELLHNSYKYNLTIFLISYIPFNWIPDLIVKAVDYYSFNEQNPVDQLYHHFSFTDKSYFTRNFITMEPNDFLIIKKKSRNSYHYCFFPRPRGESTLEDKLELEEYAPTITI